MINIIRKIEKSQLKQQKKKLAESTSPNLNKILSSRNCQVILNSFTKYRERIYTPLQTITLFTQQILQADKSCQNIIFRFAVENAYNNKKPASASTGAYCRARQKLSENSLKQLVLEVGHSTAVSSHESWKYEGRNVYVVDGTTVTMPDTASNRAAFPKHSNQEQEVGFPITKIVALMSLATGSIINYAYGPCQGKGTSEHALFREIKGSLTKGDILLGDRYYPSYFLLASLLEEGIDGVFKASGRRKVHFKQGCKDHITTWEKPAQPHWMSDEEYSKLPEVLKVREFKEGGRLYVTTFRDKKKNTKDKLAKLYKQRWQIETNLNSIKTHLAMDFLSCKTSRMIRNEIAVHFLAYNIIRCLIAETCFLHKATPNQVSFKSAVQIFNNLMPKFTCNSKKNQKLYYIIAPLITKNIIGNRPERVEPRMVKRRGRAYCYLTKSREQARNDILKAREAYSLSQCH